MARSTKCSHLGRTRPSMLLDGGVSGLCSCMPSSFCRELGAERTLRPSQSGDGERGGRQGHAQQPGPYVPPIRPVGTWLGGHRPEGTVGMQLVSVVAAVFLPPRERAWALAPATSRGLQGSSRAESGCCSAFRLQPSAELHASSCLPPRGCIRTRGAGRPGGRRPRLVGMPVF